MGIADFKERMLSGAPLAGTFMKTPSHEVVEVLAKSGLDFICLDAEHAPFDRARMDACMAIGRALDFPLLVRVEDSSPRAVLQALDMGAVGIVCPHVDSVEKAQEVARAAHFGLGGRGYAGSTRWAGFATRSMPCVMDQDAQTIVIAQIEEPAGVDAAQDIAAVDGIDGLFIGPADLSVGYGYDHQASDELTAALAHVGQAAKAQGKAYMSWVPNAQKAQEWSAYGMSMFFIGSEHAWMLNGARADAAGVHEIGGDA
ncbi:HpcH/HpaI aldolase/citrate lyase family protein [Nereida sp. MMG025]|uniref:HpcH/HpaI aldolase family protein n=1 Tax=Nereida sp. MMG025 TaxID=2909981 RepID=UPI001EFF74A0|nr:aldolase/citrate lyase family protein [Nereida sp. MMG025]MCF6445162.1 aldolase/citrate lyase family protein [Nereida sp. MMG025]